jgi:hypothetical protein
MVRYYILAAVVAAGIIFYLITQYFNNKRRKAIQLLAESLNYTFLARGDKYQLNILHGFHLFAQGNSKNSMNIMTGTINSIPFTFFDYSYTTGGGRSSRTKQQSVIVFESEQLQLPDFVLRPENLFHKIGKVFGYKDIGFENYPIFSKLYLLRGSDEESIRKTFKDRVIGYYERNQGLSTEAYQNKLIVYRASKRIPPNEIQSFIQQACEVFGLFKK